MTHSAAELIGHRHAVNAQLVWLRGGFGRGAGAACTGFRDYIDRLDDVNTDAQPSGVPPARAREPRALTAVEKVLTRACRSLLVRLGGGSKDSCMSLSHPQECSAIN